MELNIKFLYSLFEVSHVEFQSYDLHSHKLIFSSGLAHKVLGYPEEDYYKFSNNFYEELMHPDDLQTAKDTIDKILQSAHGEVVEMTVRLRRYDCSYIWVYSRQMVLERNENGDPSSIIRVAEDVTVCVELQNELEEKVAQLKTISFKNSHLLRSPVASIIGLVNLIEEHGITSDHNMQVFQFLKQTIQKLDSVIHEINDMSRH